MDWFSVLSALLVLLSITGEAYGGGRKKIRIHIPQKVKHIHHHKKIYITQHQAQPTPFAPQYVSSEQYAPAFIAEPLATSVALIPLSEDRHSAGSSRPTPPNIQPMYRARGHYGPTPVYASSKRLSKIQPAASNNRIKIIKISDGKRKRLIKKKKPKRIIIKESAPHVRDEKDNSPMSSYHDNFYSDVGKNQNTFKTVRKPKRVEKYIDGDTEHIHTYSEEHIHQYVYDDPPPAIKPVEGHIVEGVTLAQSAVPFVAEPSPPPTHALLPYDVALHHAMHSSIHPSVIPASPTLLPGSITTAAHPSIQSIVQPTVHPGILTASHSSIIPTSHIPGFSIQSTASTKQHTINTMFDGTIGSMGSLGTPPHMEYMGYNPHDVTHDHLFHDHGEIIQNLGFANQMIPPPPKATYNHHGVKINVPYHGHKSNNNNNNNNNGRGQNNHQDNTGKDSWIHQETSGVGQWSNQENSDKGSWNGHDYNNSDKGSWVDQDNSGKGSWNNHDNSDKKPQSGKRPWVTHSDSNKDVWGPPDNSDKNPWSSHDSAVKSTDNNNDYSYYENFSSSKHKPKKLPTKMTVPKYLQNDEITLNSDISFDSYAEPISSYTSSTHFGTDQRKKPKRKPYTPLYSNNNTSKRNKNNPKTLSPQSHKFNNYRHQTSESKPYSTLASFAETDSYKSYKNSLREIKDSYTDSLRNFKDPYNSADVFDVDTFPLSSIGHGNKENESSSTTTHWRAKKNKSKKKSISTQNISFGGQEHKTVIDHVVDSSNISPTIDTSIHDMIHDPVIADITYKPLDSYYSNMALKAFEESSPVPEASNTNFRIVEPPQLRGSNAIQSRDNSGSQSRGTSVPKTRDPSPIRSRESNTQRHTEKSILVELTTTRPEPVTHASTSTTSTTTKIPRKQKKKNVEKKKTTQPIVKEVQKSEIKTQQKPKTPIAFTADRGKYKYGDRLHDRYDYEYDDFIFV